MSKFLYCIYFNIISTIKKRLFLKRLFLKEIISKRDYLKKEMTIIDLIKILLFIHPIIKTTKILKNLSKVRKNELEHWTIYWFSMCTLQIFNWFLSWIPFYSLAELILVVVMQKMMITRLVKKYVIFAAVAEIKIYHNNCKKNEFYAEYYQYFINSYDIVIEKIKKLPLIIPITTNFYH